MKTPPVAGHTASRHPFFPALATTKEIKLIQKKKMGRVSRCILNRNFIETSNRNFIFEWVDNLLK
jgi:hypothetical protein